MEKKRLLLHSCCAPCFAYVFEVLKPSFDVTSFYYNPNISPRDEYERRCNELRRFSADRHFPLMIGAYNVKEWTGQVKHLRFKGEKSERCWLCYRIRLEETFRTAARDGFHCIATTLSISPYKDARMINGIGKELELRYGVEFIDADFKKNDGYRKSLELSRAYGFYRQNYCGCIYSKMERQKNSIWNEARIKKVTG